MQKKLTITIDEEVYYGLREVIGPGKVSRFIENLLRPYVLKKRMEEGYRAMAEDRERETEASEWEAIAFKDEESHEAW
ncbi:hypothetical protein [Nitratifractor sp.]|uniref:hypothetical protein n=1 Tax=Nitratifractor sp. TaxID=2268144 RepID=UPI0025EA4B5C|nr:hypothetical protein [Nitratifractor sp.]